MAFQRQMDYIDVATRLTEMREKFPDLTMSQVNMEFVVVAGTSWVVYTAAAYRTPDDPRPGIGTAWEPIPGPTSFTKDSEVQNAETAAWGRALIAIGASTKNGIASVEEVTNRQGPQANREPGDYIDNQRVSPQFAGVGYEFESGNEEFDIIMQAHVVDPDNTFIESLNSQITTKGTLTANQLSSGVKSAKKIMGFA